MKFLLDTHAFLWWVTDHPKLSDPVRDIIGNPENEIYLSAASCWEIAIKAGLGRLDLSEDLHTFIPEQIRINQFQSVPIQISHSLQVHQLPRYHRDPFDRMLVAQAIVMKMPILTVDPMLARYGVECIW